MAHERTLPPADATTLADLEFDVVRALLERHAHGPTAKARAADLVPFPHRKEALRALEEVKEFTRVRSEGKPFPTVSVDELTRELALLDVRESILDEAGFQRILQASVFANEVCAALHGAEKTLPRLVARLGDIRPTDEIVEAIGRIFDPKGQVRSDASGRLVTLREEILRVRRTINRNFMKIMKDCDERGWLADIREGYISDRRVLAVGSTHKRKVTGSVLGMSNNGSITFIEPAANVPLGFELEMLRDDERKEIQRILRELTRVMRRHLPLLRAYHTLIVALDWTQARAKLAFEMRADLPSLRKAPGFHLINAYHPLLLLRNTGTGARTEPQTLQLRPDSRMLIISGPNAGGKSITLKTVGLLQLMLQSGLLIPAHPSSEMGWFNRILTDIGDHQSIENQLSTYSYRLGRMRHFLDTADASSLLLLDEFGTGSDPELGGALAEVFFEELYARGSFGVITTHYGNIKTRAAQLPEARNGSMRFDRETLQPLYKLEIGSPGSSFTFEVAETNGISKELISRAKAKLDGNRVRLDDLIGDLQREKSTLARLTDRTLKREVELEKQLAELTADRSHVDERADALAAQGEAQNHAIIRGRKLQQFIDRHLENASAAATKTLLDDFRKFLAVERARHEDATRLAAAKRATSKKARKPAPPREEHHTDRITVGSTVRLRDGGSERGEVLSLTGTRAVVLFGGRLRTTVDVGKLSWLK